MRNKLPPIDTHVEYTHPKFNELLAVYVDELNKFHPSCVADGFDVVAVVKAQVAGSDIKWNDMAGTLCLEVRNKAGETRDFLAKCILVHFTGNCGIKSLSHLYMFNRSPDTEKKYTESRKTLLEILESFAYHKTNCGYLIGSDTNCNSIKGSTLTNIEKYGKNYHVSPSVWNPNYTFSKNHNISFWWKNLNEETHVDYWTNGKRIKVEGAPEYVSSMQT